MFISVIDIKVKIRYLGGLASKRRWMQSSANPELELPSLLILLKEHGGQKSNNQFRPLSSDPEREMRLLEKVTDLAT